MSAVGGLAQQGVELDTSGWGVSFHGEANGSGFKVLQVIPRHCFLMEFSVRWVSGLSEWARLAIRGVVALTPGSIVISTDLLTHIFKIQSLLYTMKLIHEAHYS